MSAPENLRGEDVFALAGDQQLLLLEQLFEATGTPSEGAARRWHQAILGVLPEVVAPFREIVDQFDLPLLEFLSETKVDPDLAEEADAAACAWHVHSLWTAVSPWRDNNDTLARVWFSFVAMKLGFPVALVSHPRRRNIAVGELYDLVVGESDFGNGNGSTERTAANLARALFSLSLVRS